MEVDAAEDQVRQLLSDLNQQRQLVESSTRAVAGLTKILKGYAEFIPALAPLIENVLVSEPPAPGEIPRGAEAVRIILQGKPGYWWLISEIADAMQRRGWLPESANPANAIRTAVERLVTDSESDVIKGSKDERVAYSYQPDKWVPEFNEEPF